MDEPIADIWLSEGLALVELLLLQHKALTFTSLQQFWTPARFLRCRSREARRGSQGALLPSQLSTEATICFEINTLPENAFLPHLFSCYYTLTLHTYPTPPHFCCKTANILLHSSQKSFNSIRSLGLPPLLTSTRTY